MQPNRNSTRLYRTLCSAVLLLATLSGCFGAPEIDLFSEPSGLREGFSDPDTATPDNYRDPYCTGHGMNPWTGTGPGTTLRIQIASYETDLAQVHPFLNNDEELADLRFRKKHAIPRFANYDSNDTHHYVDGMHPVGEIDTETSHTGQLWRSFTPPGKLELVFTLRDRMLIDERIAYLESLQPTPAAPRTEPSIGALNCPNCAARCEGIY